MSSGRARSPCDTDPRQFRLDAPKKAQVRDFVNAVAQGDIEHVQEASSPEIRWEAVGSKVIEGPDEVVAYLDGPADKALTITRSISHGNEFAAVGERVTTDDEIRRFALFVSFTSHRKDAKVEAVVHDEMALSDDRT
jgi:limonene-1,2-epoxide hydrolase